MAYFWLHKDSILVQQVVISTQTVLREPSKLPSLSSFATDTVGLLLDC